MAANGPGQVSSLDYNGGAPSVTSSYISNFSISNGRDRFANARGTQTDRGSARKTVSCEITDYSAFATLKTLMEGRTEHDLVVTYVDNGSKTFNDGVVMVRPLTNLVTDVSKVMIGTSSAVTTNLDAGTGWTDLGATIGTPQPSYDFLAGTDGEGRPYYSAVMVTLDVSLPGNVYSSLASFVGTGMKIAFQLPDGNWQVFSGMEVSRFYGDEDASQPRVVSLHAEAVEDDWNDILSWSDGSAGAVTPSDYFAGCVVEWHGFHTSEGSLVTVA